MVADAEPAVTVTVPVPTAVAAVSTPVDVIVPSEELADHDRARPEIAFPKRSRGVPVKVSVPPAATVAEPGETSIRFTAPGTTVTVTTTVRPPDATDNAPEPQPVGAVARPLPVVVDAVKTPDAVIVPIPPVTLHVKVAPGIGLPYRSRAPAPNVNCPPATTLATPGMTSTWSRAPGRT